MTSWQAVRAHHPKISGSELLHLLGVKTLPVDIEAIIAHLGVRVMLSPADREPPNWVGALAWSADGTPIIWISHDAGPRAKKFFLVHELGHLLLHPKRELYRCASCKGSAEEYEANAFVADVTMPAGLIRAQVDRGVQSLLTLAAMCEVSELSMHYRLVNLGLRERCVA